MHLDTLSTLKRNREPELQIKQVVLPIMELDLEMLYGSRVQAGLTIMYVRYMAVCMA